MDEFFDIPTLIVIGLAIVVLFRLRQVLGTRTGRERTPQREAAPVKAGEENVVQMRPRPALETDEDQARAHDFTSAFTGSGLAPPWPDCGCTGLP